MIESLSLLFVIGVEGELLVGKYKRKDGRMTLYLSLPLDLADFRGFWISVGSVQPWLNKYVG